MPVARIALLFAVFLATAGLQDPAPDEPPPFNQWRQELIAEARARGYSEDLIQQAFASIEPLPQVIQNDRSQAEAVVGFDRYYSTRVTPQVVSQGRELARQHSAVLASVEAAYEVQRRVVVAIWGIETRYGRVTGNTAFFRGELFDALTMVARGDIDTATMTGSWAGAMGQAQFMPSSYLKFAEDFDRDGRRDIWGSTPDALASIANYLKAWGWDNEFRWGREVRVTPAARARIEQETLKPSEGCSAMRSMTERIPLTEWQQLGVRQANGAALPESDVPAALVDTDARSFLVYPNYDTILRYNCAHYYALTVARLSDQIR